MTSDDPAADPSKIVSDYWATDRSRQRLSWLQHPVALEFVNRRVSGDPSVGTARWFQTKYIPRPLDLCLSLGCGHGVLERAAIGLGIAKRFHANDISAGAVEKAKATAVAAGMAGKVEYSVADLNDCTFPAATYDAIFASSSVHHVSQLEHLFRECRNALKPDGLLFLDEYVGPNRFLSAPLVVDIINRLRTQLPEKHRKNLFSDDGSLMPPHAPPPIEHFEKYDPSEAVRSAEIMPTLQMYFDVVQIRPYGGAIQHMLFSGIMGNFDESSEDDVALLKLIATFEEILEEVGIIDSEFVAVVAAPRPVGSERSIDTTLEPSTPEVERLERRIAVLTRQAAEGTSKIAELDAEMTRRSLSLRWLWRSIVTELRRRISGADPG